MDFLVCSQIFKTIWRHFYKLNTYGPNINILRRINSSNTELRQVTWPGKVIRFGWNTSARSLKLTTYCHFREECVWPLDVDIHTDKKKVKILPQTDFWYFEIFSKWLDSKIQLWTYINDFYFICGILLFNISTITCIDKRLILEHRSSVGKQVRT